MNKKIIFLLSFVVVVLTAFYLYTPRTVYGACEEDNDCPAGASCVGGSCQGGGCGSTGCQTCEEKCASFSCGVRQGCNCGSCGGGQYCWGDGTCHGGPPPTAGPQPTYSYGQYCTAPGNPTCSGSTASCPINYQTSCTSGYCVGSCNQPTATPEPTDEPDPTPYVRGVVKNPQGVLVPVDRICRATCDATSASCNQSDCVQNTAKHRFNKFNTTASTAKQGIKIRTNASGGGSPLVLLGVTPAQAAAGQLFTHCPIVGGVCNVWNSNSWSTGARTVTFIVATPTGVQPTATVVPPSPTGTIAPPSATPTQVPPTATPVPGCVCKSDNACDAVCAFEKYSDVTYSNTIGCTRETSIVGPTPDAAKKTLYCQRNKRTKGDVDGDGAVTFNKDYFYYVAAVNGGGIPDLVNADVNGDGTVSPNDRAIIIRSLPQ